MSYSTIYEDVGRSLKEDVLDVIFQITPDDTPVFNMLGDTNDVGQIRHEWQKRSLTTRQPNVNVEGAAYGFQYDPITTSRLDNYTQIFKKEVRVSRTSQRGERYGISDQFADQLQMRMTEMKTDIEHALVQGSLASGTSGVGRSFSGMIWSLTLGTGNTTFVTNNSLTEDVLADLLQENWDRGVRAKDVLVNSREKRAISAFTASTTKFRNQDDRQLINTISVYESDFGVVQIHLSRDVPQNTTLTINATVTQDGSSYVIAFDRSFFRKAWLDRPFTEMTAKVADSLDGVIIAEGTLEYGDPDAGGWKGVISTLP